MTLLHGDCRALLADLPSASVDAIVTDPPYELGFMGKTWDRSGVAFQPDTWAAALRVLKPGGHLLAFGGTRTFHRLACAIEDAGFELRDTLMWLHGQGFPKSLDVSKALDKHGGQDISWFGPWLRQERQRRGLTQKALAQHFPSVTGGLTGCVANWELGLNLPTVEQFNVLCDVLALPFTRLEEAERAVVGDGPYAARRPRAGNGATIHMPAHVSITAPATDLARQWDGWGTALKPGWEPILLARAPLSEPTVAANVARWGTGALNVDGCRIESVTPVQATAGDASAWYEGKGRADSYVRGTGRQYQPAGRWPANVVLSHTLWCRPIGTRQVRGAGWRDTDLGGKSRGGLLNGIAERRAQRQDHYTAPDGTETVEAWDCHESCPVALLDGQSGYQWDGVAVRHRAGGKTFGGEALKPPMPDMGYGTGGGASRFYYVAKPSTAERNRGLPEGVRNSHPTVKSVALCRWLIRLVTPPGGTVCDPFMGSGSIGVAAREEGMEYVGMEQDAGYLETARQRMGVSA